MTSPVDDGALRAEDAAAFKSRTVAQAYRMRPPYPEAMVAQLGEAVVGVERRVVDLGCGTGDISRRLATYVNHVDAVDFSREMLNAGKSAPGGDSPRIAWHLSRAEDFRFEAPYGLAVAAESLHWFDLPVLVGRLQPALHQEARLAVIERLEKSAWDEAFNEIIPLYSMSVSYRPGRDVIAELEMAGLAHRREWQVFGPDSFSQSVEDYIELQHSRSSFSKERMESARLREFDERIRSMLEPFAPAGMLTYEFLARVTFVELKRPPPGVR